VRRGLRPLLGATGAVAVLAGTHDVVCGVAGVRGRRSGPVDPSLDSELRFFAAWYVVAGAMMLRAARERVPEPVTVRLLSAGWLLAAVGRLVSIRAAGPPDPLYRRLAAVEVGISALLGLLGGLSRMATRSPSG
jgi:hypothetical protein